MKKPIKPSRLARHLARKLKLNAEKLETILEKEREYARKKREAWESYLEELDGVE